MSGEEDAAYLSEVAMLRGVYREIIEHRAIRPVREKLKAAVLAATWCPVFDDAATLPAQELVREVFPDNLLRTFMGDAFTVADHSVAMFRIDWKPIGMWPRAVGKLKWLRPERCILDNDGIRYYRTGGANAVVLNPNKCVWLALPGPGEPETSASFWCGLAAQALPLWHQASGDISDAELRTAYLGHPDETEGIALARDRILRAYERGIAQAVRWALYLNIGSEAMNWATLRATAPNAAIGWRQPEAPPVATAGEAAIEQERLAEQASADTPPMPGVEGKKIESASRQKPAPLIASAPGNSAGWPTYKYIRVKWDMTSYQLTRRIDEWKIETDKSGKGRRLNPAHVIRCERDHPEVLKTARPIVPTSTVPREAVAAALPGVKRKGRNYRCPGCGAETTARACRNCPSINPNDFETVK